jgi:hypothetical protein
MSFSWDAIFSCCRETGRNYTPFFEALLIFPEERFSAAPVCGVGVTVAYGLCASRLSIALSGII